jgi:hypothetical protein
MATFETSGRNGSTIDQSNFREIIAFLRPKPEELHWRKIPWQTDLRDACRLAAEERKPIFLWAMNGNPLGCT